LADMRALKKAGESLPRNSEAAAGSESLSVAGEFESLFFRFGKPLLKFIYSMIGDRTLAEELMQETFVRAYLNRDSRRKESNISTWLFGIAHNVVREAVKQKYRNRRAVALEDGVLSSLSDRRQPADAGVIAHETARHVQTALASLSEDHRIAFVLKIIHRLHYEEISAITGTSIGKLKTDTHRARLEMRHRLREYMEIQNIRE
jgi:RNA polymerase sigma-70 factor (ECF subfamily)